MNIQPGKCRRRRSGAQKIAAKGGAAAKHEVGAILGRRQQVATAFFGFSTINPGL